jgi:uracil-DNA glycosylase
MIDMNLEVSWKAQLSSELERPYFQSLLQFLKERREEGVEVYPSEGQEFNAFNLTPFDQVRVVILGQDPYHQPGQAEGLAFSVPRGTSLPPSLKNIYKELDRDLGIPPASHGHLQKWAEQGVFLLNAFLTVEKGKPLSHAKKGWDLFTNRVIEILLQKTDPVIFATWGLFAQKKVSAAIERLELHSCHHQLLFSSHPSPLSAYQGFLGCSHFSKINKELTARGLQSIDWNVSE